MNFHIRVPSFTSGASFTLRPSSHQSPPLYSRDLRTPLQQCPLTSVLSKPPNQSPQSPHHIRVLRAPFYIINLRAPSHQCPHSPLKSELSHQSPHNPLTSVSSKLPPQQCNRHPHPQCPKSPLTSVPPEPSSLQWLQGFTSVPYLLSSTAASILEKVAGRAGLDGGVLQSSFDLCGGTTYYPPTLDQHQAAPWCGWAWFACTKQQKTPLNRGLLRIRNVTM